MRSKPLKNFTIFLRRNVTERTTLGLFLALYGGLSLLTWALFFHTPLLSNYPLFSVADRYTDLTSYRVKMLHLNTGSVSIGAGLPVFNYLAPAAFVYSWLLNTAHPVRNYALLVAACLLFLFAGAAVILYRHRMLRPLHLSVLAALTISYPVAYLLSRANLEAIVWIFVTAFLVLFLQGYISLASVFLGLAMSIKPFPVVFVLVLLQRRRWLAAATSIAVALVANLLALHLLGPTIVAAYRGLKPGMTLYAHAYVTGFTPVPEQSFAHGILDCFKMLYVLTAFSGTFYAFGGAGHSFDFHTAQVSGWLLGIAVATGILTVAVMVVKARRMPIVNQLCACCIALTLFPPSAADYTLCSLYVPLLLIGYNLAMQTRSTDVPWTVRHLLCLALPCAVLMAPLRCFHSLMNPIHTGLLYLLLFGVLTLPLPYGAGIEVTNHSPEVLPVSQLR